MNSQHKSNSDPKKAVALRYQEDKDAVPRVVASGRGEMAERIIALARAHDIDIYEDKDLVELLSKLDVEQYIPAKLFVAVAEVLSYVYRVNRRSDENKRPPDKQA